MRNHFAFTAGFLIALTTRKGVGSRCKSAIARSRTLDRENEPVGRYLADIGCCPIRPTEGPCIRFYGYR